MHAIDFSHLVEVAPVAVNTALRDWTVLVVENPGSLGVVLCLGFGHWLSVQPAFAVGWLVFRGLAFDVVLAGRYALLHAVDSGGFVESTAIAIDTALSGLSDLTVAIVKEVFAFGIFGVYSFLSICGEEVANSFSFGILSLFKLHGKTLDLQTQAKVDSIVAVS